MSLTQNNFGDKPSPTGNRVDLRKERQDGTATVEEFEQALDEFFRQNPRTLPPLPRIFSRSDIYDDHD